jgi:hypothetical protein
MIGHGGIKSAMVWYHGGSGSSDQTANNHMLGNVMVFQQMISDDNGSCMYVMRTSPASWEIHVVVPVSPAACAILTQSQQFDYFITISSMITHYDLHSSLFHHYMVYLITGNTPVPLKFVQCKIPSHNRSLTSSKLS